MIRQMIAALLGTLLLSSWTPGATATTSPTTLPATAPATTRPSVAAQLARQLKQLRDQAAASAHIASIDLSEPLRERPPEFQLFAGADDLTHFSVVDRLVQARNDDEIAGVLVTLGGAINLAQAQEVRELLVDIRQIKPVVVYADRYDTAAYMLASGADEICILPGGEINLPGVAIETLFARGLLDKLGVQPDMIQIGEYKGAAETYTRTGASEELRGELDRLVGALYEQLVSQLSDYRKLSARSVRQAIDQAIIPARQAKQMGLVDQIVDIDGLRDLLSARVGRKVSIVADYGRTEQDEIDLSNPFALFHVLVRRPEISHEPSVALVYVDGMIVEGEAGDDLWGDSLASDGAIRRAMRLARRDDSIKAVVLRIDSPGGSALASEAAWQAIRRVAKEKPVIVSIGSMAASGGYYIACAGDMIYADPSAVVGSIGVVGGKLSMGGLYEKLGVKAETFSRGANATLFSSAEPFTDGQRVMMRQLMRQTYEQFIDRILETRKNRIEDIDRVARGRIFTAAEARELGMVDTLGGLKAALEHAAKQGGLDEEFGVRILPPTRTLADLLASDGEQVRSALRAQPLALDLSLLPPTTRKLAMWHLAMMRELERSQVMLMPPVMMRVQ